MPPSQDRPIIGIAFKSGAVLLFVAMTICIKATEDLHAGQMLFFRSLFGMIPLFAILAVRGRIRDGLRTRNPIGHAWRGLVGVVSMSLTFYAISVLPLADAVLLGYAMPLFVVVFGAAMFNERVRAVQWFSVALGFAGVIVISVPDLSLVGFSETADQRTYGIIAALIGAVLAAWAMLLVKQLVRTEASTTVVVWFSISSTLFAALSVFSWKPMTATDLYLLLAAGIIGGFAQILMTESYRHADASIIAPFEYMSIIYSVVFGYLIFGDIPSVYVVIGGAIVLSAGLIMGLSELRAGRGRRFAGSGDGPPIISATLVGPEAEAIGAEAVAQPTDRPVRCDH